MGTLACPYYWKSGASCSAGRAQFVTQYDFDWQRLDQELNQNHRPVILGMSKEDPITKRTLTHWVLATSGKGTDPGGYLVNDPWPLNGANTNLSVFSRDGYAFKWLSVYSGTSTCSSGSGTHAETGKPMATSILRPMDVVAGNVWLWHANETSLVVEVSATSSAGQVTQMQVWTDSNPAFGWQTFSQYTWVKWQPGDQIHAIFRDEFGNSSAEAVDTLHPEATSNVAQEQPRIFLPFITR
jgi:hypothetical protein